MPGRVAYVVVKHGLSPHTRASIRCPKCLTFPKFLLSYGVGLFKMRVKYTCSIFLIIRFKNYRNFQHIKMRLHQYYEKCLNKFLKVLNVGLWLEVLFIRVPWSDLFTCQEKMLCVRIYWDEIV